MRVYFILDDDPFFLPEMLRCILSDCRHEWIGVGVSTQKDSSRGYMLKNLFRAGLLPSAKLVVRQCATLLLDKLDPARPRTVRSVARKQGIPCRSVENVNAPEYLDFLTGLEPDVIVSSNGQIFRKEILGIPRIACINRHAALLPANQGMLAVFHAIASGDVLTGVSIHVMNEKIDGGAVVVQRAVPIPPSPNLYGLYEECFGISAEMILEALEILENGLPYKPLKNLELTPSYHSMPTADDWKKFKARGARFA